MSRKHRGPVLFTVPADLEEAQHDSQRTADRRELVTQKYRLTDPLEIAVFEVMDRFQGENGLSVFRVSYLARCVIAELRSLGYIEQSGE